MTSIIYNIDHSPKPDDDKVIRDGIVNFNNQVINEKATHFSVFAKRDAEIVGGALIWKHSDALYIDVIWCDERFRRAGMGAKIMKMIEDVARENNIFQLFVDTYGFQAQEFYRKQDFQVIGVIPKYMLGHNRIYLKKDITRDV